MSSKQSTSQGSEQRLSIPRAIIHKQVLDAAETKPDASLEELADDVSGASEQLVERILDEYGDPAESDPDQVAAVEQDHASSSPVGEEPTQAEQTEQTVEEKPTASLSELTEKQQEVLAAIYEHPDATQRDLGALLGVSGATVSVHANSISGFDWDNRHEFSASVLDSSEALTPDLEATEEIQTTEETQATEDDHSSQANRPAGGTETHKCESMQLIGDPDLAHRIVHACMSSDNITEAEELTIIKAMMYDGEHYGEASTSQ